MRLNEKHFSLAERNLKLFEKDGSDSAILFFVRILTLTNHKHFVFLTFTANIQWLQWMRSVLCCPDLAHMLSGWVFVFRGFNRNIHSHSHRVRALWYVILVERASCRQVGLLGGDDRLTANKRKIKQPLRVWGFPEVLGAGLSAVGRGSDL